MTILGLLRAISTLTVRFTALWYSLSLSSSFMHRHIWKSQWMMAMREWIVAPKKATMNFSFMNPKDSIRQATWVGIKIIAMTLSVYLNTKMNNVETKTLIWWLWVKPPMLVPQKRQTSGSITMIEFLSSSLCKTHIQKSQTTSQRSLKMTKISFEAIRTYFS